jgi:hypothetical protein
MAKKVNRQQRRRSVHRKAGLCVHCDKPALTLALCEAHREEYVERYQAKRDAGVCTRCGQPSGGAWACDSCREKQNEARRAKRAKN